MSDLGTAPTSLSFIWPSLKKRRVGMLLIPNWAAISSQSSTLHFATMALPSYSEATSSTVGARARQGPHHVAQKSTTTGTEPEMISGEILVCYNLCHSTIVFNQFTNIQNFIGLSEPLTEPLLVLKQIVSAAAGTSPTTSKTN